MKIVESETLKNEVNLRLFGGRNVVTKVVVGDHPEHGLKYFFNLDDPSIENQIKIHEVLNEINMEHYESRIDANFNYWKELG